MFEHESDSKGIVVNVLQAGALALALLFIAPLQVQVSLGQDGAALAIQTDTATNDQESDSSSSSEAINDADSDEAVEASTDTESEVDDDQAMDLDSIVDAFDDQPAEATNSGEVVELSVEPGTKPVLPENRPAWINAKPDYSTDIHRIVVGSAIVGDRERVDEALDARLVAEVMNYIDDKVFNARGESDVLDIDARFIRRNLINDAQGEVLQLNASGEPMFQKWVTVEITPEQREYFNQKRREAMQVGRLAPLSVGLVAVLGFVGVSHLLLRRKHGLATAQPLSGDGLVANPVSAVRTRSGSGILGFLFLGFGLLVCGVLLIGFLSLFVAYESAEIRQMPIAPVEVKAMPEMPNMPAMPEMPDMHMETTVEGGYTHETTITSGGQTIHIKRK